MKLAFTPNAISNSSFSLPLLFTLPLSHPFSAQSSSTKITSSYSGRKNSILRVRNIQQTSEPIPTSYLMASEQEYPEFNRNLFPHIEPYSTGLLKVSDLHTIYWEQSGNPNGHPVVFLHGGPGGGTAPNNRRFFDPEFYRIVLFDQRGAGKSTPHACLEQNTTWDLIDDIEKLREHLEIPEWQVFGGSWGSTLALAYSQSHPEKVTGIILREFFFCERKRLIGFMRGVLLQYSLMVGNPYRKRLNSDDKETQYAAARAWTKWEMMTAHLIPNDDNIKKGDDDYFSLAFARIENHYFVNKAFFPSDSFLLDNVDKIRHINTVIVQGRYDICCPMMSAWDLHKAWPEADFRIAGKRL
ncbi:hypothetical protein K1719_028397 [Acacia pycnantha]|nr:hypothetical protein K1719_028397 [Acacia pycnantha]